MSSNSTSSTRIWGSIAWLSAGVVIAPCNLLVALSIIRYKALRTKKEYVLMMGLAAADSINMVAFISSGSYDVYKYLIGRPPNEPISWLYCLLLPHVTIWSWAHINVQLLLLIISADRLLSVALPLQYIQLSYKYAVRLVVCSTGFTMSMGAVCLVNLYSNLMGQNLTDCPNGHLIGVPEVIAQMYLFYFRFAPTLFTLGSIVLYILILPVYRWRKGQTIGSTANDKKELKMQQKVTRSLGISCACTFFLYVIPFRVAYSYHLSGDFLVSNILFAITATNALANCFIYELRHPEMWLALKSMLKCKEMPAALNLWNVAGHHHHHAPSAMASRGLSRPRRSNRVGETPLLGILCVHV